MTVGERTTAPAHATRDWPSVRLDEVATIVAGSTPSTTRPDFWGGEIVWVTPTDLGKLFEIRISESARRLTSAGYRSCGTELVPRGSVVLSTRAPIGHLGIADTELCTNQGCKCIVPGDLLDSGFLYYCLKRAVPKLQALGSGATFTELPKSKLASFSIPLPPLGEQRRIAAMLTEQMAHVERARAAAKAQLDAARALPGAHLRAIFESDEAQSWPARKLLDIAKITAGVTIGRKLPPETRLVPYMRVANVKDGRLALDDVATTPATESEIERARLRYGDLLLTEGGDMDKLGRGDFWRDQLPECIHQNHIFRVRFDLSDFDPRFASAQVGSSYGKRYFAAHAKHTTGIASINRQVLSGFPFLAPSRGVQAAVAESLDYMGTRTHSLERAAAESLAAINRSQAALLSAAFVGSPDA